MSALFSMGVIFGMMVMNPFVDAAVDPARLIRGRPGQGAKSDNSGGIDQGLDNIPNQSNTIDVTNYIFAIGVILAILLVANLVVCIKNSSGSNRNKKKQYYPIKYDTSEFGTESEDEAINVDAV